jgi:Domain of unknown function (DUF4783)
MSKKITYQFLIAMLIVLPAIVFADYDVLDTIANGIRAGDSRQVSKYFDSNVEITIADRESSYSRAQGEMILRDFFQKNPVKDFSLLHRGASDEGSLFCVGTLKTQYQNFRTYYLVRSKNGASYIQELRFEKQ